jgi:hypothetical protein
MQHAALTVGQASPHFSLAGSPLTRIPITRHQPAGQDHRFGLESTDQSSGRRGIYRVAMACRKCRSRKIRFVEACRLSPQTFRNVFWTAQRATESCFLFFTFARSRSRCSGDRPACMLCLMDGPPRDCLYDKSKRMKKAVPRLVVDDGI